ncbi:MAG: hypothetical protein ACYC6Y_28220 [Thermoguttaceae bacterium]
MKTPVTTTCVTRVGRCVAPEDLKRGDLVSLLTEVLELPSFLWCQDSQLLAPNEPVRMPWCPDDAGTPLKVKAICLPFVFAKAPGGDGRILDVRRCQLVRLSSDYARSVWKSLKKRPRPSTG